ncbi:MAG: hypothetical protein AABY18_00035 [Candidatus Thermoplasmatota archaeon]
MARSARRGAPKAAGKPASRAKPAKKAARPRVKRAPPPMVYEEPQLPAVVPSAPRPGVFEADAILAPRPGAKPPQRGWRGKPDVRLRCPACGHGNDRAATVCEHCRALL